MKNYQFILTFIKIMLLLLILTLSIIFLDSYQFYSSEKLRTEVKIKNDSIVAIDTIKIKTTTYLNNVENSITSINSNQTFINYLNKPNTQNQKNLENLFKYTMKHNKNIFLVRYIDNKGLEKIRIEKNRGTGEVFAVDNNNLQDKSNRYYTKEILQTNNNNIWYSDLDLNIENEKLDSPIRPTYRIGLKVVKNNITLGFLIVNIDMSELLDTIQNHQEFDIFIYDKDGDVIISPNKKINWSKYLDTKYNIYDKYPSLKQKNISEDIGYLFSLSELFKNKEQLQLLLEINDDYLKKVQHQAIEYIIWLLLILLVPAMIIAIIITLLMFRIFKNFANIKNDNKRYSETIDKYVVTMTTDVDHTLTFVSEALCNLSGYTKKELLGKKASIFKSGEMNSEHYKSIKKTIHSGLVWSGELQNKTKNGDVYWLNSTIVPNYDNNGKIKSFTAISENITDKKIIDKISETDKLTQLYNRVKLDKSLIGEINEFTRYKNQFSIILIDIDHFKSVNDTYGHNVGDEVLVELAKILIKNCRVVDIVGRWGGEEFMIICTQTQLNDAVILAEKIRQKVASHKFNVINHTSVSIGVAEIQKNDDIESLIKRADDNLYKAKDAGRNRVIFM